MYSSTYLKKHRYTDSHKDFPSNEKSIELATLIERYWSSLEAELLRDNVAVIIPEYISMDELFKFHLRYAQKCYKWGELVISDNEDVAFEPLWEFVEESDFMIDNQSKKYRLATASQDALAETIIKSWSQNNENIKQAFDANVRKK